MRGSVTEVPKEQGPTRNKETTVGLPLLIIITGITMIIITSTAITAVAAFISPTVSMSMASSGAVAHLSSQSP